MNGTNCSNMPERIVLAAYGELPDDEAHQLALHLEGCLACQEEQNQLLALKTLTSAMPVEEPNANLVARSRTRLEQALDALPPRRWYDRVAEWMTRTAGGLQSAPAAACLLLVAGAGLGSLVTYEFAARHAAGVSAAGSALGSAGLPGMQGSPTTVASFPETALPGTASEVASVSGVAQLPHSNMVAVTYNQVEPRRLTGTLDDPQIRELLMLASQNGASTTVRDDSVALLAAECRSGRGCAAANGARGGVLDALMVALRYDRSATVRQKALEGLEPFVSEDPRVRDAVLEALENDPDAKVRSAAIDMLQPVDADTSVREVLSTVALSDQNSHIRDASRLVLQRVSEVQ